MESRLKAVFFKLLRSGLWGRPLESELGLPLSAPEWEELYQQAISQTVEGIMFDAVNTLDNAFLPSRTLLYRWAVRVEKIEQHNRLLNHIVADQTALFQHLNLKPILLKGQGIMTCYNNPMRRIGGDIDWYFGGEEGYKEANRAVEMLGISLAYDSGQSACYTWKKGEIDHHQKLFDSYNPFLNRYLRKLENRHGTTEIAIDGKSVSVLSPLLNMVQVNLHILKHLLSFGVGLRQLCDAARLYYHYRAVLDKQEIYRIYVRLGIISWIDCFHHVLTSFIGLSEDDLPFETKKNRSGNWMIDEIWQTGNFGFHDSRYGKLDDPLTGRNQASRRVGANIYRYLKYAPMEAISFPIMQSYNRYFKK